MRIVWLIQKKSSKTLSSYKTKNNQIVSEEKVVPPPHEPGLLPKWLAEKGTTDIIAGGMGNKAIQLFNQHKVNVIVGAPKLHARDLVEKFNNGTLDSKSNYCDH